jgi:hypothetical protein
MTLATYTTYRSAGCACGYADFDALSGLKTVDGAFWEEIGRISFATQDLE